MKTKLTRRALLKTGPLLTGGLLASGVMATAAAQLSPQKINWDKTFDVIVIGSGLAGLSAGFVCRDYRSRGRK